MKTLKDDLGLEDRAFQRKTLRKNFLKVSLFSVKYFVEKLFQKKKHYKQHFDEVSFDALSFDEQSFNKQSFDENSLDEHLFERQSFDKQPLDEQSFDKQPLNEHSFDQNSFDQHSESFERQPFQKQSFNKSTIADRPQKKKSQKGFFSTFFKWSSIFSLLCTVVIITFITFFYFHINNSLPKINDLTDYRPPTVTNVFSDDGTKIGEFYKERRIVLPLSDMPPNLMNAFVAAEDSRFREHVGIDLISIIRAFVKNMRAGSIVQGGSTITQQVTKSFLLTPERTYKRKIKEAILAYRIDKTFSKDDILFLYLNQIYLGHGAYGVEAAAQNYFDKHAKDLDLAECSMLAGLPQAPSRYSPFKHPELARQRQIYVLTRMQEEGYITTDQMNQAMAVTLDIQPRKNWFSDTVPWYTEYVRRYVIEKYGDDMIYNQGINIYTAVNIHLQKIAEHAVANGLHDLDKRHGYGGPLKNVSSLGIDSFSRKIAASLPNNGFLEKDKVYKGVITDVNLDIDVDKSIARVKVGNNTGIINISDMAKASIQESQSNDNNEDSEARVKKDFSEKMLKIGDVVLVRTLHNFNNIQEKQDIESGKGIIEEKDIEWENNNGEEKKPDSSNKIERKQATKRKTKNQRDSEWEFALELEPEVEGALISIEAETGHVKAMVGGRNYHTTQFNRAVQSRRQPGSAFKPIIYAAALDKGYTTSSIIIDSPIAFKDGSNKIWRPQNYKPTFYGPTRLREALVKSRNVVTVKIVQDIGVDYVIEYAKQLGITSPIEKNLSIALGSCGLSLLELVKAYTVFSNLGYLVEPVFVTKIVDRNNEVIEDVESKKKKVIDMSTAYIMTNMMESVVESGTATKVKELERPVAGKTGTTNDLHDALFVGYTPQYTTGVWVGFDKEKTLGKGESGARSAIPIWLEYMKSALEGTSVMSFNVPEGVVFHNVDPGSGLLSDGYGIPECFKEGVMPTRRAYTPPPPSSSLEDQKPEAEAEAPVTETEDLFKSDI